MAANLRNIKRRIRSISGIRQITRAMEMVSATKLKRSLERIEKARPYFEYMDKFVHHLIVAVQDIDDYESLHPLMKIVEKDTDKMIVTVASDKGLCASFNANIIRETFKLIDDFLKQSETTYRFTPPGGKIDVTITTPDSQTIKFLGTVDNSGIVRSFDDIPISEPGDYQVACKYYPDKGSESIELLSFSVFKHTDDDGTTHHYWSWKEHLYLPIFDFIKMSHVLSTLNITSRRIIVLAIGRKVFEAVMKRNDPRILLLKPEIDFDQSLPIQKIDEIIDLLSDMYISEIVNEVDYIYTKYYSATKLKPVIEQFLPLGQAGDFDEAEDAIIATREYIFEPSASELLKFLVPTYARAKLYQALGNSFTSENLTRMTAMRHATDNAADLIDDLTLKRNKARQSAITKELSEIVAGAEAL